MGIDKDLPELIKAGVISEETGNRIREYYKAKSDSAPNRLFVAFGILGSLLVGLGIILIIAHNWDDLSRTTKTVFAFLPLILAQAVCAFVLLRKSLNAKWIESAATFLILSVGACIALIGQIYHIPGDLSSFLLTWLLLSLPLIYVMKSSAASLLYIVGITYYAMETGYFSYPSSHPFLYWGLWLAVFPHYYLLFKNHSKSNFLIVQNWLIPLSTTIALGTWASKAEEFMFVAYFSLFGLFYVIGNNSFFKKKSLRNNSYKVIGTLGTLILLFVTSFDGFWKDLRNEFYEFGNLIATQELWVSMAISVAALGYLYKQHQGKPFREVPFFSIIFLLFIVIFCLGYFSNGASILINLIILTVSILTIIEGTKQEHFGVLNFGLSIITLWIIVRFLNTDLSFVVRGLLLMAIGIGFFAANYLMLKKRKNND